VKKGYGNLISVYFFFLLKTYNHLYVTFHTISYISIWLKHIAVSGSWTESRARPKQWLVSSVRKSGVPHEWWPDTSLPGTSPHEKYTWKQRCLALRGVCRWREPVPTRVPNPNASEASYKPEQRRGGCDIGGSARGGSVLEPAATRRFLPHQFSLLILKIFIKVLKECSEKILNILVTLGAKRNISRVPCGCLLIFRFI